MSSNTPKKKSGETKRRAEKISPNGPKGNTKRIAEGSKGKGKGNKTAPSGKKDEAESIGEGSERKPSQTPPSKNRDNVDSASRDESNAPAGSKSSQDFECVKLVVGKKRFYIPKWRLCKASRYYDKTLNGPWRESQTGEVRNPDDVSVETFEIFANWMQTGKLLISREEQDENDETDSVPGSTGSFEDTEGEDEPDKDHDREEEVVPTLSKDLEDKWKEDLIILRDLYIFADEYDVPGLCKAIINKMEWRCWTGRLPFIEGLTQENKPSNVLTSRNGFLISSITATTTSM
ncbi:uncharacterized protein BDZ99DRAFT_497355 [Mytilinidion resinicola]|uniref:BTB domain-containing protein n=1 Tax=Mytilinidion resinicola TaxID=574789 RepID=A0A6A6YUM9_9PEZI|nr:uncharacterized protein BDZ99DRAFT_497355 [Mytilinidion resinicola]KAF2811675.1 hypothetical protein BDZ99DRAFT_497355 [Mytilinidion resinicola]